MAPRKKPPVTTQPRELHTPKPLRHAGLWAAGAYTLIACLVTFPLIFKLSSSVYGPYDHLTTDMFSTIYTHFWWIAESLFRLHQTPFLSPMLAAPFGTPIPFSTFTGFVEAPLTLLLGPVGANNVNIIGNLILAGLGMFLLVRYLTGSAGAGFVAGIVFAFCPNMLVRSYTTYDSTQVQWIPFYTLYLLAFLEKHTWKNALLAALFLVFHILFSFPYYLVYLPVHTAALLIAVALHRILTGEGGIGGFIRGLLTPEALRAWGKVAAGLAITLVVFGVYYATIIGGGERMATAGRTTEELSELSQTPGDYLAPHPRSTLFAGNVKAGYWDAKRPRKDPDSFVAYIGYVALLLAAAGVWKGRGPARWAFIVCGAVAFWSTMGPSLGGIPTPSGLIHGLYASFARRILIYKVFVQFSIAGLAGMGFAALAGRIRSAGAIGLVTGAISLAMMAEYAIVPPALSVDLTEIPEVYQQVKALPDSSIIIEVPVFRMNRNSYQGYAFNQITHRKRLFNPFYGAAGVPAYMQDFYSQLSVPAEATDYANLAALRYLGVSHLVYHWYIGTKTVQFGSFGAPGLLTGAVEGLTTLFVSDKDPGVDQFKSPYDYTFATLSGITADPCPIAVTYDYHSPYDPIAGALKEDFLLSVDGQFAMGWASALTDTTCGFYFPLADSTGINRVFLDGARIRVTNMADQPVDFTLAGILSAPDTGQVITALWNGRESIGSISVEPTGTPFELEPMRLEAHTAGDIILDARDTRFSYPVAGGSIPAAGILKNVRVRMHE